MPQMSPMNWLMLLIYFMIIYFMLMSKMYFYFKLIFFKKKINLINLINMNTFKLK
uniref:ATP synthase FO subunit 8 n=1 Tax=Diolcogaster sp. SNS-2016 TaxID=1911508 RepID=A0A6F8AUQ7_9HYME|nr:ATP synthase FO subunit 8 [Diolcogaster sp. SNS-2016]